MNEAAIKLIVKAALAKAESRRARSQDREPTLGQALKSCEALKREAIKRATNVAARAMAAELRL